MFANNKRILYEIDSFITYSNCQNWCCLLTSAGEVSHARERETVTGNRTINVISSSNQHGRSCLLKWRKTARGNRPHIFTGMKPVKNFYILPQWGELFQGFYTLKFERWYNFYAEWTKIRLGTVYVQQGNKLSKLSRTFNVQQTINFIQFARIPVEFVARL